MAELNVKTQNGSYNILIENGALKKAGEFFNLKRKVLIVTDLGVPKEYADTVASLCESPVIFRTESGEQNKCLKKYSEILKMLTENNFDRKDCITAIGGGVMGDLAGFAAATYMRGIDFYNIPTTLLSQVDSSIGGKTAIDFEGCKNIVGAFYPPKGVLIDPEVLNTLSKRQFACGMAEAVKMFATFDGLTFSELESGELTDISEIIIRALRVKKSVVEKDEKESGLRMSLNFGHTVGHAIESASAKTDNPLLHGECVSLGMMCFCSKEVKTRLEKLLKKYNLPTDFCGSKEEIKKLLLHDKKCDGDTVNTVYADKIGSFVIKKMTADVIIGKCEEVYSLK